MNGKSTNTPASEERASGKGALSGEKSAAKRGSGSGRKSVLAPSLAAALQEVTAQLETLQKRLTQMETRQKAQEKAYRATQSLTELRPRQEPPAGMTAMQVIMGQLDVEETTEELLAQLKALD